MVLIHQKLLVQGIFYICQHCHLTIKIATNHPKLHIKGAMQNIEKRTT